MDIENEKVDIQDKKVDIELVSGHGKGKYKFKKQLGIPRSDSYGE